MGENKSSNVLLGSIVAGIVFISAVILMFRPAPTPVTLPIQLDEYSDFQCPACKAYYPIIKQIETEMAGKVNFTYHHFPLTAIHNRAYAAAVASEAAREQGKFDEYHDKLFEGQPNLTDEDFFKYADEVGMDVEKFKNDYLNNADLKTRVDSSIADGDAKGINSTPTFFINGKKFTPNYPEQLIERLNELIKKAETTPANP